MALRRLILDAPEPSPLVELAERIRREEAGNALDLPPDFARNHNHYIHGAEKQL
jgi:hypothetical protein